MWQKCYYPYLPWQVKFCIWFNIVTRLSPSATPFSHFSLDMELSTHFLAMAPSSAKRFRLAPTSASNLSMKASVDA